MAAKIRKGDKVVVLTGRDKGRTGEVIEVRRDQDRALVRGVNMVKRHQRQTAQQEGGIISKESSVHLSNLAVADPKDGKPTRVGFKFVGEATRAKRCALPSVPELRSMADTQQTATSPRPKRQGAERARPAARKPKAPRRRCQEAARALGLCARAADAFREGGARRTDEAVRLTEPHAGAQDHQGGAQHGHRRGCCRPQEGG